MMMLSYCAGLRACEIASLRIRDVIGSDGEAMQTILLECWQTKGSERQQALVSEKLRKEITKYVLEHRAKALPDAPLLASQKGGSFSSQTIQQVFRKLYGQVGMDGASSHSGRRTMLTKLADEEYREKPKQFWHDLISEADVNKDGKVLPKISLIKLLDRLQ